MEIAILSKTLDGFAKEFIETDDGFFWTVSNVLSSYVQKKYPGDALRGKRILELGSGLGNLAVELQSKGAIVTCSDGPWGIDILRARTEASGVKTVPLLWGEKGIDDGKMIQKYIVPKIDFIIGSELIGDDRFHDDLIYTLQQILPVGVGFLHAFADRPFSGMFFAKLDDAGFDIEDVADFDAMGLDHDRVAINWIYRRPTLRSKL